MCDRRWNDGSNPISAKIRVIRERDPAIKSNSEVFLYPSFRAILWYRLAHRLYQKKTFFLGTMDFTKSSKKDRH